MALSILIGADIAPADASVPAFEEGKKDLLLDEPLLSLWEKADLRLFDLEIPFTEKVTPIAKCGPALRASEKAFAGIKALCENPSFVTLANNHILDMGKDGLLDTLRLLKENGIPFGGAGMNAAEASGVRYIDAKDMKIGILCCCENEFSGAGETTPGAALFDPLETPDLAARAKESCDALLVLYHGGPEEWPYPTPDLQKRLRKLIDKGADAVFCQHGHITGCMETYNGFPIVYGQGNFLFAAADGAPCWKEGLLIELRLEKGKKPSLTFHPTIDKGFGRAVPDEAASARILKSFFDRSEEIQIPGRIREKTLERANMLQPFLGRALLGNSLPLRTLNVLTGRKPMRFYDENARLRLADFFRCETLREIFLASLTSERKE